LNKRYFDIIFTFTAPQQGFVRIEAPTEEATAIAIQDALNHFEDLTIDSIQEVSIDPLPDISTYEDEEDGQLALSLSPTNSIN
jgi:hypothetical protein